MEASRADLAHQPTEEVLPPQPSTARHLEVVRGLGGASVQEIKEDVPALTQTDTEVPRDPLVERWTDYRDLHRIAQDPHTRL